MAQKPVRTLPVDPDRKDENEIDERDQYMSEAQLTSTQFGVGRENLDED